MSALRLMLVSYPPRLEPMFEHVVASVARFTGPTFAVERCQTGDDALRWVRTWRHRAGRINRLELFGHGRPGAFSLGDEVLFSDDGTGLDTAEALGDALDARAAVALLGCNTAARGDGRWLWPFERALGARRTLWGCPGWISTVDFRQGPLSSAQRRRLVRAHPSPPAAA